jgi:acyl carrier protein
MTAAPSLPGVDRMSVRSKIISQFESVAKEQNQKLPPLSDDLVLLESGLDSLCFAVIVARLEDELGFDPFTASEDLEFPITFSDFVRIYENGAG